VRCLPNNRLQATLGGLGGGGLARWARQRPGARLRPNHGTRLCGLGHSEPVATIQLCDHHGFTIGGLRSCTTHPSSASRTTHAGARGRQTCYLTTGCRRRWAGWEVLGRRVGRAPAAAEQER